MGLATYKKKRSFNKTPEPTGGVSDDNKQLHFVIQKHDASHLHYDFRLELRGVLKSWAVPKGPSMDPSVKRLAMEVEDHPYDYRKFEGIIPKGEYGGGTVIVWDEGIYVPADEEFDSKEAMEKHLYSEWKKGKIMVVLLGQKLKGKFVLVKSKGGGADNAWLLMKYKDEYARKTDILKKASSVISGKTIQQMEKDPVGVWGSNKKSLVKKKLQEKPQRVNGRLKKAQAKKQSEKNTPTKAIAGKRAKFPEKIPPMLATLVDQPFDEPGWMYEIKWDGYRAIAHCNGTQVHLKSRNDKSFDEKFYPVVDALKKLNFKAVLDGEIVVLKENGTADFGSLQNWRSEADGILKYYVFDVLWLDGKSLLQLPLSERRAALESLIPEDETVIISKAFHSDGIMFYEAAGKMQLEGIMAKRESSEYVPGERSKDWLKIKVALRHEVVIGGYTKNDGTSKAFSALLAGVYKSGKLHYTGKIGTGFSDKMQAEMMKKFKPLERKTNPFEEEPDINKPSRFRPNPPHATVTWLKPELVGEVSYTELTSDGIMRHPSFEGLRDDKKAKEVLPEKAKKLTTMVKRSVISEKNLVTPPKKGERKSLLNPTEKQQVKKINGHELTFTNLDKIYWPKEKITKRDMINYYYQVAPYILPHLKDRPQSLNRFPNGITGESFYQKDVTDKVPDWVDRFPYTSEGKKKNFLVCNDESELLLMASLGCIEINPWNSTIHTPDNPDWCVIDLDPSKDNFNQVIEAALVTKEVFERAGITSYCKTSGSTGLHIYVPLKAKYTYEESKEFGRLIATLVQAELPNTTSIERTVNKRKGKIYIDFLQNRPQATIASVYSLRPKPGASVSMPLHWEEVKTGLKIKDFTIKNAMERISSEGDIFKPVLGKGIDMLKAIKKLNV
ncbi:DNA ligase D [Pollutibacter soli]|uniref:DNA ligase D n=1 Tax=Pollutibacter soli TaxID=3034157 RepID=UPI003014108F